MRERAREREGGRERGREGGREREGEGGRGREREGGREGEGGRGIVISKRGRETDRRGQRNKRSSEGLHTGPLCAASHPQLHPCTLRSSPADTHCPGVRGRHHGDE